MSKVHTISAPVITLPTVSTPFSQIKTAEDLTRICLEIHDATIGTVRPDILEALNKVDYLAGASKSAGDTVSLLQMYQSERTTKLDEIDGMCFLDTWLHLTKVADKSIPWTKDPNSRHICARVHAWVSDLLATNTANGTLADPNSEITGYSIVVALMVHCAMGYGLKVVEQYLLKDGDIDQELLAQPEQLAITFQALTTDANLMIAHSVQACLSGVVRIPSHKDATIREVLH